MIFFFAKQANSKVTNNDLNECAKSQNVEIKQGDFVIVRTGQMEQRLDDGEWGGYAGGDAPGLAFETAEWIYEKEIAAIYLVCAKWSHSEKKGADLFQ